MCFLLCWIWLLLPLPNYYTLFWPWRFGCLYTAISRNVWGLLFGLFIVSMELETVDKTENQSKTWLYQIFSSPKFLLFSRLNFSTYLWHCGGIILTIERYTEETVYMNYQFFLLFAAAIVIKSYFAGFWVYSAIEYPFSIMSNRIMRYVMMKK